MTARRRHPARLSGPGGFALTLVLIFLLLVALVGVGILSIATSDLHGAIATRLALDAATSPKRVCTGGPHSSSPALPKSRAMRRTRASRAISRSRAPRSRVARSPDGHVRLPRRRDAPGMSDDPATAGVDERDLRHLTAVAAIRTGPGGRAAGSRPRCAATPRGLATPVLRRLRPRRRRPRGRHDDHSDVGSNGDINVGSRSAIRQLPCRAQGRRQRPRGRAVDAAPLPASRARSPGA